MIKYIFLLAGSFILSTGNVYSQSISFDKEKLEAINVSMTIENLGGKNAVKVIKEPGIKKFDEPTFVRIKGTDFRNGTLEVKVLSRLLKDAPDFARGFIGVAFHINDSNTRYESIYMRPLNARADDQVRRNHSIQYYAYPDYKFDRLRKESPERYESYSDMEMNQWIRLRIEVNGTSAKLFINDKPQPALIVNDLKHGANISGGIGLWVDIGTEGYFTDLKVSQK